MPWIPWRPGGGWYSELNGRGGPESADGCVGVQEFTNVWRGEVVEGLEGEEQNLEMDAGFDREPVKLLKDRSDVINGGGSGDRQRVGTYKLLLPSTPFFFNM
ncbi:unnamed protein product [Arctogadus glacialis]